MSVTRTSAGVYCGTYRSTAVDCQLFVILERLSQLTLGCCFHARLCHDANN